MPVPDAPCTLLARIKGADASVFYCLLRPARAGALIRRSAPKRSRFESKDCTSNPSRQPAAETLDAILQDN